MLATIMFPLSCFDPPTIIILIEEKYGEKTSNIVGKSQIIYSWKVEIITKSHTSMVIHNTQASNIEIVTWETPKVREVLGGRNQENNLKSGRRTVMPLKLRTNQLSHKIRPWTYGKTFVIIHEVDSIMTSTRKSSV